MDPVLGKFFSEDPAYNGQNWYVYCSNNPVNLVDETGKFDQMPICKAAYVNGWGLLLISIAALFSDTPGDAAGIAMAAVFCFDVASSGADMPFWKELVLAASNLTSGTGIYSMVFQMVTAAKAGLQQGSPGSIAGPAIIAAFVEGLLLLGELNPFTDGDVGTQ